MSEGKRVCIPAKSLTFSRKLYRRHIYSHTHTHVYIYTHTYIHTYIHIYTHIYDTRFILASFILKNVLFSSLSGDVLLFYRRGGGVLGGKGVHIRFFLFY